MQLYSSECLQGSDVSLQEVVEAIKMMKAGKAAGPDGIPIDMYKKFKDKLRRPILDMLLEALEKNMLPVSMSEALIILLPKPGKPNNKCEICTL